MEGEVKELSMDCVQELTAEVIITEREVIVPRDHYEQLVKESVELGILRKAYESFFDSYRYDDLFKLLFGPKETRDEVPQPDREVDGC